MTSPEFKRVSDSASLLYGLILGYCVLPVVLYIWLEYSERRVTLKGIYDFNRDVCFPNDTKHELINSIKLPPWVTDEKYRENKLFIISGPSGSGKTTLFKAIQKYPYIIRTISDTTRDIRNSEKMV